MAKFYCPKCNGDMDEVDFMEFGMCLDCHEKDIKKQKDDCFIRIKYPKLRFKRGNKEFYYVCNSCIWNWFLNRFYPSAELTMIVENLKITIL